MEQFDADKLIEQAAEKGKVIKFSNHAGQWEATLEEDIEVMDRPALLDYLERLHELMEELDKREPEDMESEEYDDWALEHEDLEDRIDEVEELLEL